MKNLAETARRIREDAEHSGYKLGAKSTTRLIAIIEAMAVEIEAIKIDMRGKSHA